MLATIGGMMTTEVTKAEPLDELCETAALAVVAEVTSVGPAPGAWSGRAPSLQRVEYVVREAIRGGPAPGAAIAVEHAVVKGGLTAEPGEAPRLSAKLFAAGARVVVIAERRDDGAWVSLDERLGAQVASEAAVAKVRAACGG